MSYLSECNINEAVKTMKGIHRFHRDGYSNDRAKSMRHVLKIDARAFFNHPEINKYFDPAMDPHEARKHMYAFAKKYPQYVVVDKL